MTVLRIDTIGVHDCTGCHGTLPEVVRQFCADTETPVDFHFYSTWDCTEDGFPAYVRHHIEQMRQGDADAEGFFLQGEWLPLAPHNTMHTIEARRKLVQAAGTDPDSENLTLVGRELAAFHANGSRTDTLQLADSAVGECGSFHTEYDNVWFFEGRIGSLTIDACPVDRFFYMGYDINRLIEIARQHPELFMDTTSGEDIRVNSKKASLQAVQIRLLTAEDLHTGRHPCVINGGHIDPQSRLHAAAAAVYGGWGYEAVCEGQTCGFLGILPKSVAYRDAGFLPPSGAPMEKVLLLTCYAGGGVFGPQFDRIGIMTALIMQAVGDARKKGYTRIEAYAHPEVESLLCRCGFTGVEWKNDRGAPSLYYTLSL